MYSGLRCEMKNTSLIDEYLMGFEKPSTRRIYRGHLNSFFDELKTNPDTYFTDNRDYDTDMLQFWRTTQKYAPCTRSGKITCIKQFFEENEIAIKRKTWNIIKRQKKKVRPRTIDHVPTNKELRSILQHGGIKERALFLVMASSGIRIGEALSITLDDLRYIDVGGNVISPAKIIIRQEISKNETPRITFISDEARDAVIEWLKVRDNYLKSAVIRLAKLHIEKKLDDDRLFPYAWATAWKMWSKILEKSGYDKKFKSTNRFEIHIHCMRKFFINRLKGVIRPDAVEQLVGHEGYLDVSYRKIPEDELQKLYLDGMDVLNIFEITTDLSGVHSELKEKDKQISDLERKMQELTAQVTELRLERIEKANGIKKK